MADVNIIHGRIISDDESKIGKNVEVRGLVVVVYTSRRETSSGANW